VSQVNNIAGSHSDDLRLTIWLNNQSAGVINAHCSTHNLGGRWIATWQNHPHTVIASAIQSRTGLDHLIA
jgi:hypothetical protein